MRIRLLIYRLTRATGSVLRPGKTALFIISASALGVCLLTQARYARATPPPESGTKVVATVGSHQITEQELDQRIRPQLAALGNRIYEMKRQALEAMVDEYLLQQAASKEHLSVQDYLKRNLKTTPVTEADARQLYDKNKAIQRIPFDKIKPRIIAYMQQQRQAEARAELLAKLKKSSPVKVMLEPPRFKVATAGRPSLGPNNAPITIVEFADFQCPFCGRVEPTVQQVLKSYGDKVRLVYINFPLGVHPYAFGAAQAAECAGAQGKFWPYHNALFVDQSKLTVKDLKALAGKLGLNTKEFDACLDQGKTKNAVEQDLREGQELGVTATPSFFINGRMLVGAQPLSAFQSTINEELGGRGARMKQAAAN